MAVKNIEMNYKNENGYDVLYPQSVLGNVIDWQNSIYNKTQVDSKISTVNSSISSVQSSLSQQISSVNSNLSQQIQTVSNSVAGWQNLGTFNGQTKIDESTWTIQGVINTGIAVSLKYQYWIVINIQIAPLAENGRIDRIDIRYYNITKNIDQQIFYKSSQGIYSFDMMCSLYPGPAQSEESGDIILFKNGLCLLSSNPTNRSSTDAFQASLEFSEGDKLGMGYRIVVNGLNSVKVSTHSYTIYRNKVNNITF